VPGQKGKVVVTSMLGNAMKADTDVPEWHAYFRMLDCAMQGGRFEQEKLKFKYWSRSTRTREGRWRETGIWRGVGGGTWRVLADGRSGWMVAGRGTLAVANLPVQADGRSHV